MRPLRAAGRGSLAAAGLLLLLATACSPADPGPTGPTTGNASPSVPVTPSTPGTPSGPSTPDPTSDPEAALRTQLAEALRATDPASAGAVANPKTALDVVATGWLPGWQVVDVNVRSMPHPRRFYVGLSEAGQAQYLSGRPQAFDAMVTDARIRVGSGRTAVAVGTTFLDATRTFQRYAERVEDLDGVSWRKDLSPAEQQVRDEVLRTYGDQVRAPRATPDGDGWTLTAWMVDGTTLVRHDLAVAARGTVTDTATVVARDLPVPYSG
jgi:hypothetical protein